MKEAKSMGKEFNKSVTYKEMKARQKEDLNHGRIVNTIHRSVSTYMAFFFIKIGIKANQVTLLNFIVPIVGFYFLSLKSYLFIITGLMFFFLFRVLDDTDGEIARATKTKSLEGFYFEHIQDYIYLTCLGIGLGIAINYLLILPLTLVLIVEYSMLQSFKSVLKSQIIKKKVNIDINARLSEIEGVNWQNRNVFLRIFGIYPSGLLFSIEFIAPVLMLFITAEYITNYPILINYLIAVIFIKLFRILIFIKNVLKKKVI